MLHRVLEKEVMEGMAEAIDYDAMDHAEVNRAFVADLAAALPPLEEDAIHDALDIGVGTALIPIEICQNIQAIRITGIDLAASMLHVAKCNIEVAGLTDQIRLDLIDAKALPYLDEQFSVVMSNTILHHIPEPLAVLRQAWRVVAPGGLLFIRDLLRPETDEAVDRLVAQHAAGANERQRRMFDDSLRAALTLDEVRGMAAQMGLGPETVTQTSDRHWTMQRKKQLATSD